MQIDALPKVVEAVAGRCEVYLDGGVRLGTDILKAIALGAQAVFIGRPAIYALAYNVSRRSSMLLLKFQVVVTSQWTADFGQCQNCL